MVAWVKIRTAQGMRHEKHIKFGVSHRVLAFLLSFPPIIRSSALSSFI